jgi:hypothetical protein
MFLVEIVTFMIAWPILWWLGGRLARDSRRPASREAAPDHGGKVVDLEAFRRRREAAKRRAAGER